MTGAIPLFKEAEIQKLVKNLAQQVNEEYAHINAPLVLVCPLKGSVFFLADFVRYLTVPVVLDFIYVQKTARTDFSILKDIKIPIKDRQVLIVKEVINSGKKLVFTKNRLLASSPEKLKILTLLDKPSGRSAIKPDFSGIVVDDRYIFGYGMDHEEKHRHLRDMFCLPQ